MSLSVGIVGLPNVGKSTLFNALLKKQQAYAANFPFATIEPNIGVVLVPDERLEKLAKTVRQAQSLDDNPPEVYATVEFKDIAGLIAGAHKGEGLGNKFLAHIREADAVCHVVRAFTDPDVIKEGSVDPKADLEVIETELQLADLQTLEKQKDPGNTPDKELKTRWELVVRLKEAIEKGIPARNVEISEEEKRAYKELSLLTSKPILIVLNVDESQLSKAESVEQEFSKDMDHDVNSVIAVSAKIEAQLAELDADEQQDYLSELGAESSGLERIIKKAFTTLGLATFLTAGEKEVRAWTIKKGMSAVEASGVIHTDFQNNFIKADVINWEEFVSSGGWKQARELGKVRQEGRDYIVQEGDLVEFKIGQS